LENGQLNSREELLKRSCLAESAPNGELLIKSSFKTNTNRPTMPASNGFVDSSIRAYRNSHHLILRSDDIWLSILIQMNVYIIANSDQLCSQFVIDLFMRVNPDDDNNEYQAAEELLKSKLVNLGFVIKEDEKVEGCISGSFMKWYWPGSSISTQKDKGTTAIIMMSTTIENFMGKNHFIHPIPYNYAAGYTAIPTIIKMKSCDPETEGTVIVGSLGTVHSKSSGKDFNTLQSGSGLGRWNYVVPNFREVQVKGGSEIGVLEVDDNQ
jgi:hypothetical protein